MVCASSCVFILYIFKDGSFTLSLTCGIQHNKVLYSLKCVLIRSPILWQQRQLPQPSKHHWDQMVSNGQLCEVVRQNPLFQFGYNFSF